MAAWHLPRFDPESDFEEWIELVDSFVRSEVGMTPARAVAILKAYGGSHIIRLLKTLQPPGTSSRQNEYRQAVATLRSHFAVQRNTFMERAKFREMQQMSGKSIKHFAFRIREQAGRCGFGDPEEQIHEQLVQGMVDKEVKRRALLGSIPTNTIVTEVTLNETLRKDDGEPSINFVRNLRAHVQLR